MPTTKEVSPLARLRERVGERVSPQRDNPREESTLTRRAREDASHRPGRVGLSRKRERRGKPADRSREVQAAAEIPDAALMASRGRVTRTTVPTSSLERSFIEPPWSWASERAIARPRPEP